MIFLFLRWDMLISRRVDGRPHEKAEKMCQFYPLDMLVMCIFPFLKNQWSWNEDFKKVFQVSRLSVSFLPFLWVSTCVPAAVPIYVSNYPSRFPGPFPSLFKKKSLPIILFFCAFFSAVTSSPLVTVVVFHGSYTTQLNIGGYKSNKPWITKDPCNETNPSVFMSYKVMRVFVQL